MDWDKLKIFHAVAEAGSFTKATINLNLSQSAISRQIQSLEDELKVRSFVKSITKTSFFMNQIITKDDEIIIEAQVHLVFINKEGKPVKIPDEIYLKFKPYFCDSIKN